MDNSGEHQPLLLARVPASTEPTPNINAAGTVMDNMASKDVNKMPNFSNRTQWIALALISGSCAAFNGVFAKL